MTTLTEKRMQLLLQAHAVEMRKSLEGVLAGFAETTNAGALAAAKMAEEGPTRRLRDNLVASFFSIRLKASDDLPDVCDTCWGAAHAAA